jgi:anti-sigma-K factor RskA
MRARQLATEAHQAREARMKREATLRLVIANYRRYLAELEATIRALEAALPESESGT